MSPSSPASPSTAPTATAEPRRFPFPPVRCTPGACPAHGGAAVQPVEIYTTPLCGYCHAAKRLLAQKGVAFTEIDLVREPARRAEMLSRAAGRRTVPQIFVGDTHVGGCDDLYALDRAGKLDALLGA